MKINARKEAGILNPNTNNFMELDIFLPDFQLALEFQVCSPPHPKSSPPLHSHTTRDYIGGTPLHERQQIRGKIIGTHSE